MNINTTRYLKSILIIAMLFLLYSKIMAQTTTKINRITVAVFNEEKMKYFYENVFDIRFKTIKNPDFNLYVGDWSGMEIQFCSAEVAKNTATQNRHQFHINVKELDSILKTVKEYGGSVIDNAVLNDTLKQAFITDPDGNTIVVQEELKQAELPPVVGIGGVFFKSENPEKLKQWYENKLGIPKGKHGFNFSWGRETCTGYTVWSPFEKDTEYFKPSNQEYMINFRVSDLDNLLKKLKEKDVIIVGRTENYKYGRFAWILDLEGNKIELWEANDKAY